MNTVRRELRPLVRVLDTENGTVEYVASDESLDSYGEVIRASGWRFTHFKKNAPFVDSHDYSSVERVLGRVLDFRVEAGRLIERVQFAKDVGANHLAQLAWEMTKTGFLKAVSVGFWPVRAVHRRDSDRAGYDEQLRDLGLDTLPENQRPKTIYLEQEQIELSAVVIGANPNALTKALVAGVITQRDFDFLCTGKRSTSVRIPFQPKTTPPPVDTRAALLATCERIAADAFVSDLETIAKKL